MTRDHGLEELLREELGDDPAVSEKAMFGGLAFLWHGRLLCAARHDGMLVRLGKGQDGWALEQPDIRPMAARMPGWIKAGPDAYGDDALRAKLLAQAFEVVRGLE
ncbi:cold-shock protein [Rhodovarius crocodyli]|uniref:Cold-shock protein n=1 Tax=Rhodovarius crocodyli TaxID=1979269 RepID=A0A437MFH1_9PROT|nr:cold-shock protein [Rhodovarius crocodyli]RVT96373.1 cold-shock protein [Rhodovarius crocodyli]